MSFFWLGIICVCFLPAVVTLLVLSLHIYVRVKYLPILLRVFCEKPLFIIPRGEPKAGAESVQFATKDRLMLQGCYLKTEQPVRKGVILFGLEYGSNRWSCLPYCEPLLQSGYDIFAFEPRNQGDSDRIEGYDPLQWITEYELEDTLAAIDYLESRPDASKDGIGYFGISRGANAGLLAAVRHRAIRCITTDGAFATKGTMLPYMRKWVSIYNNRYLVHGLLPSWFYGWLAMVGIRRVARERGVRYLHIEKALGGLRRPLLMIHGEKDTYIKVDMAQELYEIATSPKELWIVPKAKHNQCLALAGDAYSKKVIGFFDHHLAGIEPGTRPIDATADTTADMSADPATEATSETIHKRSSDSSVSLVSVSSGGVTVHSEEPSSDSSYGSSFGNLKSR